MQLSMPAAVWTHKMGAIVAGIAASSNVDKERVSVKEVQETVPHVTIIFAIDVIKGIKARVPVVSGNLANLKRNADAGGLTLGGVKVTRMSEVSEHTAVAPGGMPRRVRPASGPVVVNMGVTGHEWREFDDAVETPAPANPKEELLDLHAVQGWMHYHAVERRVMAAATRRYNQRKIRESFFFWRNRDEVLATVAFRQVILQSRLGKFYASWREIAKKQGGGRSNMNKVLKRLKHQSVGDAMETWRSVCAQTMYSMQLLKGSCATLLKGSLSKSFRTWRDIAHELSDQKWAMQGAVRKLLKGDLYRGWLALQDNAYTHGNKKHAQKKAFARLHHQGLYACFFNWRSTVATAFRQMNLLRRVTIRMIFQDLAMAMYTWQDITREEKEQKRLLTTFLKKFSNLKISAGWERWREVYIEVVVGSLKGSSAAKRAMDTQFRKMAFMFFKWKNDSAEDNRVKAFMLRVAHSMMNQGMFGAFRKWREDQIQEVLDRGLLARCCRSILNLSLKKGWTQWSEFTVTIMHQKQVALRAAEMMFGTRLGGAFNKWVEYTQDSIQVDSMQHAAINSAKKLFMRNIVFTWNTWREQAAEGRGSNDKLKGMMRRLLNRALGHTFNTWREITTTSREQYNLLKRTIRTMLGGKMERLWMIWRTEAEGYKKTSDKIKGRIKKLLMGSFQLAFHEWREMAYQASSWQWQMAVGHWQVWATVGALMTWRATYLERQVSTGWWDMHTAKRASWRDKIGMLQMFDVGMKHCKTREVEGAYKGWLMGRRDGGERGLLQMWAVVWCAVQKIRYGITHWRFNAAARGEKEAISMCAHQYWCKKATLDHTTSWRRSSKLNNGLGKIYKRVTKRLLLWKGKNTRDCWRHWRQGAHVKKATNLLSKSAAHTFTHKIASRYFRSWRKSSKRTHFVKHSLETLTKEGGRHSQNLDFDDESWERHKLNWGLQAAKGNAPRGVGGMAYSSATLANHDRGDWAESMSRVYMGLSSPAAYRRNYLRKGDQNRFDN